MDPHHSGGKIIFQILPNINYTPVFLIVFLWAQNLAFHYEPSGFSPLSITSTQGRSGNIKDQRIQIAPLKIKFEVVTVPE
jgi:hypothetical protein